jgi:hypothetical protein
MSIDMDGQSSPTPSMGVSVSVPLSRARAASVSSLSEASNVYVCLDPHAVTAESFELVKKSLKKMGPPISVWWSAFHLYAEIDAKPAADHPKRGRQYCCCNECGEDYVVDETGATGGLMRHMEKEHKKAYTVLFNQSPAGRKRAATSSQPNIREAFGGAKRAKTKSEKKEECAELTSRWVVKTLQPYSSVESEDF